MSAHRKNRLRDSTAHYDEPAPKQPKQPTQEAPADEPVSERNLSAAAIAAAKALRTRQQRGQLRKTSNLRGGDDPPPERFLTWADLFERGVVRSKTQARRLWERGNFPKPVHLSERVIAFRESEINAWVARIAERAA